LDNLWSWLGSLRCQARVLLDKIELILWSRIYKLATGQLKKYSNLLPRDCYDYKDATEHHLVEPLNVSGPN
jgi:hypothetical protein